MTNVGDNSNVTYFGGVFIGSNWDPFIVYTVQNYRIIVLVAVYYMANKREK